MAVPHFPIGVDAIPTICVCLAPIISPDTQARFCFYSTGVTARMESLNS